MKQKNSNFPQVKIIGPVELLDMQLWQVFLRYSNFIIQIYYKPVWKKKKREEKLAEHSAIHSEINENE